MSDEKDLYFHCSVHPDRMGIKDEGIDAENRYPCRECYAKIMLKRSLLKDKKETENEKDSG